MAASDFITGGSPTPGTSTTTGATNLPQWYTDYVTDMLGKAQAIGNLPYPTYQGPRIAGFTPSELAGFRATEAAAGAYRPSLESASSALGRAGEISGLGAAQPDFTRASGMMGAQAAMPFLAYGARTFPEAVEQYMNPYTKQVVEQIGDIGARQLREKYLPAVGEEFIKSGQFGVGPGSTRMGEFGSRALRDVQEAVLAEQSKALQAGYGQAADIFASDASRIAEIGKATGQLTQQDAETLAKIGSARGELSLRDAESLRDLASKYLGAAEAGQTLGLRGAEAITGVGKTQREMQQANLNLAYQDFLKQQGYPAEQIKFLSDVLTKINLPQTTTQTTTSTLPQPGEPSGLQKFIEGLGGMDKFLEELRKIFGGS